ncbi:MAG: hypothetical protein MZV63_44320 [Marinilabiliales bacterium]|nr:hypothetical protein [Marinilabiliales bacterium]
MPEDEEKNGDKIIQESDRQAYRRVSIKSMEDQGKRDNDSIEKEAALLADES